MPEIDPGLPSRPGEITPPGGDQNPSGGSPIDLPGAPKGDPAPAPAPTIS